jgi:sugar lactone lactonase YvrE
MRSLKLSNVLCLGAAALGGCQSPTSPSPAPNTPGATQYPQAESPRVGKPEVAHRFNDQYPTGVAVSREGRVFACFPRWEDPVKFTVGEVRGDGEVPYPNQEMNADDGNPEHFFSVQSVVVDPANRLWVLDTGSVDMQPIKGPQWPKLVGIDLKTNKAFQTIHFPPEVVLSSSYINDVRFDLRRGPGGTAYISDSSSGGSNALIVVDLASGKSLRRLRDHPSVKADKTFAAVMEGQPMLIRKPGQPPRPAVIGSDGIAVNADGSRVFYCPLTSRSLYSVDAAVLADPPKDEGAVAATVREEKRTFASDGLDADAQGRIYLTDWEHNAVVVREPDGQFRTLVHDQRMWWPDSLAWGADGTLYFTCTQLHRQRKFNEGQDKREKPYLLMKVKTDAAPITQGGR